MSLDPQLEKQLRHVWFKRLNKFMLFMWQLGLGWMMNVWPAGFGRIMVITHTGWKSGLRRRTPVNYAHVFGEIYCTAGFGRVSHWYKNIQANPNVEIWLPDGWWEGVAEDVSDAENRLFLMREVLIGSGFAAHAAGINPKTITDEELANVAAEYRLLHIRRTKARTGPGGPGELAWVWPVVAMLLLPFLFRRKSD
jgi:deazaflavin-dependent oxidoreductase (nitroreductase family)